MLSILLTCVGFKEYFESNLFPIDKPIRMAVNSRNDIMIGCRNLCNPGFGVWWPRSSS